MKSEFLQGKAKVKNHLHILLNEYYFHLGLRENIRTRILHVVVMLFFRKKLILRTFVISNSIFNIFAAEYLAAL